MHGLLKRAAPAAAAGLLALGLAACGGGGGKGGKVGGIPTPVSGQKKGGTLKVLSVEGFEHLDPGSTFFQLDYQVAFAVHRPLFSFKPDNFTTAAPDLAAEPAKVSADQRTVTVKIRPNVRYSPGTVNRAVTSADVKYAIERGYSASVANGYAPTYFNRIVGADRAKGGPIAGIQTPDPLTIVFKLSEPLGATFVKALSMPLTVPVPREYAAKFDRRSPSGYDADPTVQAFTGPYVISSYRAGRSLVMTRNPNWSASTDFRPAYLDRIEWSLGVDPNVSGRQILTGSHLVNGDTPSAPIIKLGVQRYHSQISFTPLGNRFISMNTQLPPFNNINVRKAVVAAMDRVALQKTRGGQVAGIIATHFLAPTAPGFEAAGGNRGPGLDFLANPHGDLNLARQYLRRAGFANGRYSGPPITMVGDNSDPAAKTAQVALANFRRLGFKVNFRSVSHETMYSKFCNVPKTKIHVCPNVGWLPDFPDGYAWLAATFQSSSIVPENNSNWPQLRDPRVDAAIRRAQALTNESDRDRAWGEVDRLATATAAFVPWFWDNTPNIESRDVQGVIGQWNAAWDLSYSSLK